MKIGKCVTDHLATQAKQERAMKKYPEQEQFGFRILGMKIYNKSCEHFTFHDKSFGKNLKTAAEILKGNCEQISIGGGGILLFFIS